MKQLSTEQRVSVVAALVEGNSINSTVRMTGTSKPTILKLLADLGKACQKFHDDRVRGLSCKRIECDEIWAFIHAKEKNVPAGKRGQFGYGDTWTWTAIDADTKLMVGWLISGDRRKASANAFLADVAERLTHRVQLTTDGLKSYLDAVYNVFGNDVDHAVLVKLYGNERGGSWRYSPPEVTGVEKTVHCGSPDPAKISTSYVERSNLTARMSMRRYTRLTNGFSKKLENHRHMTAIFFTFYNFCRRHMTLKTTPAVAAGLADRVWEIEDLIGLISK
jgi:hypothetical protein